MADFLRNLKEGEADKEITSSFSSIRKTVFHVYGAQKLWLKRLDGTSLPAFPPYDSLDFPAALDALVETSVQIATLAESCTEEALQKSVTYKNLAGQQFTNPVSEILMHVANHGSYHRGQLITMLRQLGYSTLFATDYIAFTRL
jgi:uncharacterized damage-inducible protein DinB